MHKWELITLLRRSLIYQVYSLKLSSLNSDWMSCFLKGLSNCPKAFQTAVSGGCWNTFAICFARRNVKVWWERAGRCCSNEVTGTETVRAACKCSCKHTWGKNYLLNIKDMSSLLQILHQNIWHCPQDAHGAFCRLVQECNICSMTINFMRLP